MAIFNIVVPEETLAVDDDLSAAGSIWNQVETEDSTLSHVGSDAFTQLNLVLTDDLTGDDGIPLANAILQDLITDDLTLNDALAPNFLVLGLVDETLDVNETMTLAGVINEVITEGGTFGAIITIDGVQFVIWAANTDTFAHSQYENYDFDSMIRLGEKHYGSKDDGIYELTGSNDAGSEIDWFLSSHQTDAETALHKRWPKAYLGFSGDGFVYLRTIADNGKERIYMFKKTSPKLKGAGVTLGRGVKSRYWMCDLVGVDGSDIDIEQIEFYPVVLGRRV